MKAIKIRFLLFSLIVVFGMLQVESIAQERVLGEVAMATPPPLYESVLTSLTGEIYINPRYSGKINYVRSLDRGQLLGEKTKIEARTLTDGWKQLNVPSSMSGAFGLVISGGLGIVKLTLPEGAPISSGSGTLRSISNLFIEFGSLHATLTFPKINILEPSKVKISILDTLNNSFIPADIVALKNDQAAVLFRSLPSSVVNEEGMVRISLQRPDGSFVNSDIPAWGYNIVVSETDTGVPAPITADVFGLPDDTEIKFNFVSLSGQIISPSTKTLSVGEINKGVEISTITTKIQGPQPITVTVIKLN